MGALEDYESLNTPDLEQGFGALSMPSSTPSLPDDVQSRRDMFNQAAQRLLQQRQMMQAPNQGQDLGMLAMGASLGKASGMPVAQGYTEGALNAALAQQKQQEAMQQYQQQQSGLDMQAQLAQILGNGGTMADASSIAAISGNDKIAGDLAKLDLYGSGRGNATLTAARELMKNDPSLDFATAYNISKGKETTVKNGKLINIDNATAAAEEKEYAKKRGVQNAEIDTAADIEAQKIEGKGEITPKEALKKGQTQVATVTDILRNRYTELDKSGGMVNPDNSTSENIGAYIANTPTGQTAGKMTGTKNQTLRNQISQTRPLLINAIRQATGMSAKAMDSNTELQFYLQAATDPLSDTQSAMAALDHLNTLYGLDKGGSATKDAPTEPVSPYKTPEDIGAAYKSGKLTKEQAKAELKAHGIE